MRRMALVGVWILATAVAVATAWGGVRLVTGQVVAPLPAALLESGPDGLVLEQPAVEPRSDPASTEPPESEPGAPGRTASPAPSSSDTETRTYQLVGGIVSVAFSPTAVTVVQATPHSGFSRTIEMEGPLAIKVEFEGDDHRSRLDVWWDEGPQRDIREDDRS